MILNKALNIPNMSKHLLCLVNTYRFVFFFLLLLSVHLQRSIQCMSVVLYSSFSFYSSWFNSMTGRNKQQTKIIGLHANLLKSVENNINSTERAIYPMDRTKRYKCVTDKLKIYQKKKKRKEKPKFKNKITSTVGI